MDYFIIILNIIEGWKKRAHHIHQPFLLCDSLSAGRKMMSTLGSYMGPLPLGKHGTDSPDLQPGFSKLFITLPGLTVLGHWNYGAFIHKTLPVHRPPDPV